MIKRVVCGFILLTTCMSRALSVQTKDVGISQRQDELPLLHCSQLEKQNQLMTSFSEKESEQDVKRVLVVEVSRQWPPACETNLVAVERVNHWSPACEISLIAVERVNSIGAVVCLEKSFIAVERISCIEPFQVLEMEESEIAFLEHPETLVAASSVAHRSTLMQMRWSSFFPVSKRFREIYGHRISDFQIEISRDIEGPYSGWVNFDWLTKQRHVGGCCRTRVRLRQISFGLKWAYPFLDCMDAYLGFGPSLGKITLHNKSCCVRQRKSKYLIGLMVKSGVRCYISEEIFIDFFVDYLLQRVHFDHHLEVGGLKAGIGFGVRF